MPRVSCFQIKALSEVPDGFKFGALYSHPVQEARRNCVSRGKRLSSAVQGKGFEPTHLPHPTPRLAGAPDISPCPQSRKDVLFAKAHEVFRNASTVGEYYYLIRPYLGEP